MTKDLDQKVAHAMGLKSVNNCEKWGTSMTQEALKLALEALESCDAAHITDGGHQWHDEKLVDKAITAIKEALAHCPDCGQLLGDAGHIHTCSPQRTWVGLTDEEMYRYCPNWLSQSDFKAMMLHVEAKLKEKNNG